MWANAGWLHNPHDQSLHYHTRNHQNLREEGLYWRDLYNVVPRGTMVFINSNERTIIAGAVLSVAALLIMSAIIVQYSNAATVQNQPGQGGLKFFIKYSKSSNATTTAAPSSSGANSTSSTKKITVNVNLQRGPSGSPIKLPITAIVPASAKIEDLQLCASLPSGSQSCQPLSAKGGSIDLTKQSQGTTAGNNTGTAPATTASAPTSPKSYISNNDAKISGVVFTTSPNGDANQYTQVDALIGITNTSLNIPVTVIVPVNVQIQNAQVCASVLSGGSQSCEQLVLNPSQTTFSPISVNLNTPTPTFMSTPSSLSTSTPSTTTNPLSSTLNGLTQPSTSTPPPSTSTTPPSTSTPTSPSTSTPTSPSTSTSTPSTGSGSSSSGSTGSSSSGSSSGSTK